MKKLVLIFIVVTLLFEISEAQIKRELITMASGDSVVLFLTVAPRSTEAFHIYREGPLPTDNDFELLTKDSPVKPVVDPNQVRAILGDDWPMISKAFNTTEPFEILRKLRSDEFVGVAHSLLSPRVARLTGRWFIDIGVEHGSEYTYKVVYVDSRGKELATIKKKTTVSEIYPAPPYDVKTEIGDTRLTLTWNYPKWEDYSDLAVQYFVYRKIDEGSFERVNRKPIIRNDMTPPEYTDLWLENGTEYSYYITAVDPINRESEPSQTITAIPKDIVAPSIPQNLSVESGDGVVGLSWNMSVELDVDGYYVYRSLGLDKDFERLNQTLVSVELPFYIDSSIVNGVQYFYSVTAFDKSSNESQHSNAIATIGEDKTPPDSPTDLTFEIENRILKLAWTPSKANDVVGYYIYRGQTEDIQPRIVHEPYKDTVFIDSGYQDAGMTAGKSFLVSVTAADRSRNESEKTTIEVLIPDDDPPLPPQAFMAKNVEGRFVKISCGTSPSLDVATYKVFRKNNGDESQTIAEFNKAPFGFKDTLVVKGRRFQYYATAFDSAGNQSEPGRIDTVLIRDYSSPPSPRNINVKLIETGIKIKWERVVDFDLVGYNVYRSNIPSGVYEKLNKSPLRELEFIDSAGTIKHYYKVKAVDSSGNESTRGDAVHAL
jgi:fibronectin type 3 domain-containing protein